MSTLETGQTDWTNITDQKLDSKYEKCRNITEEIYKRINITFQIKKLEACQSELSDNSEQIDSNELSNETDLFACDKSDLTSSTEAEKPPTDCVKFININNNEEKNKPAVCKRPRKRFRKRVKKRTARARSDSEGSSDEAPLSRIADADVKMKPSLLIVAEIGAQVLKPKPEKRQTKKDIAKTNQMIKPQRKQPEVTDKKNIELGKTLAVRLDKLPIDDVYVNTAGKNYRSFMRDNKLTIKSENKTSIKEDKLSVKNDKGDLSVKTDRLSMKEEKGKNADWKNCSLCSLSFRGERGLRRHMSMSHIISPDDYK